MCDIPLDKVSQGATGEDGGNAVPAPPPAGASQEEQEAGISPSLRQPYQTRQPRPPPPPRPDHFLALRVSHHSHITSAIAAVQSSIALHSPHLQPAFVDPASAHITLGVLSLRDEASRQAASELLATAAGAVAALQEDALPDSSISTPPAVVLEGLSNFRDQVLFLDMRRDDNSERLFKVVNIIRSQFQEAGLLLQADRPFVPHVTIAKVSKMEPWNGSGNGRGRGRGGRTNRNSNRSSWKQRGSWNSNKSNDEGLFNLAKGEEREEEGGEERIEEDIGEAACAQNSDAAQQRRTASAQQLSIPLKAYADHINVHAGVVDVVEIQLCAMQGRGKGGYYPVLATASLLP